jgi:hypothetical protein
VISEYAFTVLGGAGGLALLLLLVYVAMRVGSIAHYRSKREYTRAILRELTGGKDDAT